MKKILLIPIVLLFSGCISTKKLQKEGWLPPCNIKAIGSTWPQNSTPQTAKYMCVPTQSGDWVWVPLFILRDMKE